jgi:repressor LexA
MLLDLRSFTIQEQSMALCPLYRISAGTSASVPLGPGLIAYKVEGDNMSGAGIDDGDHVMVRPDLEAQNGQIGLLWLQNQGMTVKRLLYKGDKLILKAENPVYQDLVLQLPFDPDDLANEIRIIGKVIGIVKKL